MQPTVNVVNKHVRKEQKQRNCEQQVSNSVVIDVVIQFAPASCDSENSGGKNDSHTREVFHGNADFGCGKK